MADFFIHRGPTARPRRGHDLAEYAQVPAWVRIVLEGSRASLSMLLPTGDLDELHPGLFEHWVPAIQGPIVTRCEGSDEQREQMLHIALAMHAFTEGYPGVIREDYYPFMALVVESALSVDPDERADEHVGELVEWLHSTLPEALFNAEHIPPITEEEFTTPLVFQLANSHLTPPVFDHWTGGPRDLVTVDTSDDSDGDEPAVDDSSSVSSSSTMPPLVDYNSDSD